MNETKMNNTHKLTVSAMLIATAVVLNYFRMMIPIGGAPGLSISFGGPFIKLTGILFGPAYGSAAGAAVDLIVHFISPKGAYIWELTLVEFIKGGVIAFLFRKASKMQFSLYSMLFSVVFLGITMLGALNCILAFGFPDNQYSLLLNSIGARADYVSIGLLASGVTALAAHTAAYLIFVKRNRNQAFFERYLRLLPAVGLPCIILTIVNTFVLRRYGFFTSVPFIAICIPRVVEELLMVLFNTYLLSFLSILYEKIRKHQLV